MRKKVINPNIDDDDNDGLSLSVGLHEQSLSVELGKQPRMKDNNSSLRFLTSHGYYHFFYHFTITFSITFSEMIRFQVDHVNSNVQVMFSDIIDLFSG